MPNADKKNLSENLELIILAIVSFNITTFTFDLRVVLKKGIRIYSASGVK